ncbi:DUF4230 domain-containing protein [Prevotella sp.]|uniref:DUF4230 domain-containing protein n=1 Tax=Prevotella sp. TaxID=59823 RepID=UPI002F94DA28
MENKSSGNFKYFISHVSRTIWLIIGAGLLLIITIAAGLYFINRNNHITLSHDRKIEITPTQLETIEAIGEWEFLAITDEELVDTVRKGFFGDSELVRIYYGTLRLGINLRDAEPGWIKADHDTIKAVLPPIRLLDKDFIDEAKTRSFYEQGNWDAKAREQLYDKAYHTMLRRCMTPSNIKSAEENASRQFHHLLTSMGFEFVQIRFKTTKEEDKG